LSAEAVAKMDIHRIIGPVTRRKNSAFFSSFQIAAEVVIFIPFPALKM
jgi:hypothetical protein